MDKTELRGCLAEMYDIPEWAVNISHLNMADIKLGDEYNACTEGDNPTSHFPEVSICVNPFSAGTDFRR